MHDINTLNNIIQQIKSHKKCLVLSHQNPDGDTLGSMLALGEILQKSGHVVDHVMSDPVPEVYKFLPFTSFVRAPGDASLQKNYDLAFSLDCGSLNRLASAKDLWLKTTMTINIDHHVSNERFGKINWIEPDATSTGQLVYWLLQKMGIKISTEVATCLYTTLLTDTGCFSNSNTNAEALQWGAELIKSGADHINVYRKAFLEKPYKTIKVFATGLNNINLIEKDQILWTFVGRDAMEKNGATSEDTEDIADYMMRTNGVKVGIFFREDKSEIKVSLRSNVDFDVSKIAISMGGGGHKRAAGINIKKPLKEVQDLVLNTVTEEFKKYNGNK